jgi:hypothetical protein
MLYIGINLNPRASKTNLQHGISVDYDIYIALHSILRYGQRTRETTYMFATQTRQLPFHVMILQTIERLCLCYNLYPSQRHK